MAKRQPVAPRFFSRINKMSNGCWEWTGTKASTGYGLLSVNGKNEGAHRVSVILSGREIPHGMHIDHLCRNPICVNPGHLEVVSPGENILRGETITAANVEKTHCPNGHPLSGENLDAYALKNGRRACRECMRQRCRDWHWRNRDRQLERMRKRRARAQV